MPLGTVRKFTKRVKLYIKPQCSLKSRARWFYIVKPTCWTRRSQRHTVSLQRLFFCRKHREVLLAHDGTFDCCPNSPDTWYAASECSNRASNDGDATRRPRRRSRRCVWGVSIPRHYRFSESSSATPLFSACLPEVATFANACAQRSARVAL